MPPDPQISQPVSDRKALASLLESYYGAATAAAGWSPDWDHDAERILGALPFDETNAPKEGTV